MKFREKLNQFMMGRYGQDELSRFSLIVFVVLALIGFLVRDGAGRSVLNFLMLAVLVLWYLRVFSRNFEKRRRENAVYLKYRNAVVRWFKSLKDRWTQRKDYRFFRCPSCHTLLRVPKGKGRVRLTCRKCQTSFERKT